MRLRNLFILLFVILIPFGANALAQEQPETPTWSAVGEGIDYQKYRLSSPTTVNVFVARMARANPATTIESSIADGYLAGSVDGHETVSGMAARYDDAINFWGPPTIPVSNTWGSTNDVIVAINGFYYGPIWEDPGVPWSGQIHSGWYAKRYYDNESSSGFIWKMDRSAFIGACITHPDDKQNFYNTRTGETVLIDGVNRARESGELILYTPQYYRDTNTDSHGTEVLVEMEKPTYTSVFSNMPYGTVRKIRIGQGSTPIPYDHVVLSGTGAKAQALIDNLNVDDKIGIAQRIKDCALPTVNNWDLAYAGVGGHWRFLRNGVVYPYSDDGQAIVRDPRTAIAYNNDYIFFIVADGRNPGISDGMTVEEMANFAKNTLHATDGIMQDGGGSSTMVVNGEVVNNTFCNDQTCPGIDGIYIYLPFVSNSSSTSMTGAADDQVEPLGEWDAELLVWQRLVANGMLMVNVQPKVMSSQPFHPGDPVTTNGEIDIYMGPGTNYLVLNTVNGDGTIADSLNQLGGVYAKGTYWWKVHFTGANFDVVDGWVREEDISPQLKLRKIDSFKTR